jgi:cytochrome c oxidase subunit II
MRRLPILAAALATGCGAPAVLDPASPQAARIAELWWWFVGVCLAVYVAVVAIMAVATLRRRPEVAPSGPRADDRAGARRRQVTAVGVATGLTVVVLIGLLGATVVAGHRLAREHERDALRVEVTGKQWWWSVRYPTDPASDVVVTANEIHVPIGRTVRLELRSSDVIHSFWVPRLHGKRDLIPGRATELRFRVDEPGVYTGQCAEFCGHQHAHMLIRVVAEEPAAFEAWRAAQRAPARAPETPEERRGHDVFLSRSCALCHAIRGTDAGGQMGPDLTHLASRESIAAGTLPNRPGHLAGWIMDAQAVKPGTRMPANPLPGPELQALLAYLRSLR